MAAKTVNMSVHGLRELDRAFAEMGQRQGLAAMKAAVSKASTLISKQARANARRVNDTGLLAKSIGKRTATYRRSGTVAAIIGPRGSVKGTDIRGNKRVPTKYAHLIEFGTAPHIIAAKDAKVLTDVNLNMFGRIVQHPGAAPRPLMRAALTTVRGAVLQKVKSEGWRAIARAAEKLRRRTAGVK